MESLDKKLQMRKIEKKDEEKAILNVENLKLKSALHRVGNLVDLAEKTPDGDALDLKKIKKIIETVLPPIPPSPL
jgi:hypothetical protein